MSGVLVLCTKTASVVIETGVQPNGENEKWNGKNVGYRLTNWHDAMVANRKMD